MPLGLSASCQALATLRKGNCRVSTGNTQKSSQKSTAAMLWEKWQCSSSICVLLLVSSLQTSSTAARSAAQRAQQRGRQAHTVSCRVKCKMWRAGLQPTVL